MITSVIGLLSAGVIPSYVPVSEKLGIAEFKKLGCPLLYSGIDTDFYFVPGKNPVIIAYWSDRIFDIATKLDFEVKGKGVLQSKIAHKCFDFAELNGIKTARIQIPCKIPSKLAKHCMAFELCWPLEIELPGGMKTGLNMTFKRFLTGSLWKDYYSKKLDPFNLKLTTGMVEWAKFFPVLFTPSTMCYGNLPINHKIVRSAFPEVVEKAENLFVTAYDLCFNRGFIIPEGNFTFFVDSKGDIVLGMEFLTPESTQYITAKDFQNKVYISVTSKVIKNFSELLGWDIKAASLKRGKKLKVDILKELNDYVLMGYESIFKIWE